MKMADYFQPSEEPKVISHRKAPGAENGDIQSIIEEEPEGLEDLVKVNEKEILENVNINFLFAKGFSLVESLIDMNRVYLVMGKIKELARQQVLQGSKDIDYDELVAYLQQLDDDSNQEIVNAMADPQQDQEARWARILDFMRSNPKLLMQMIPDTEKQPPKEGSDKEKDIVFKRSRVADKILEAQKWQRLQKLASVFVEKRQTSNNVGQEKQKMMNSISSTNTNMVNHLSHFSLHEKKRPQSSYKPSANFASGNMLSIADVVSESKCSSYGPQSYAYQMPPRESFEHPEKSRERENRPPRPLTSKTIRPPAKKQLNAK